MTISMFILTSESRGGRHGEAPASHDEKKTSGEERESESGVTFEANEGQSNDRSEATDRCEDRQSHQSHEQIAEINSKEEVSTMKDETLPPKAKAVKALGSMFNDPRITNVLMLVLVLIGMGGAEAVQSQVCSL